MHPDAHDPARDLAGPVEPPPGLKQRVTRSLRTRGLLAAPTWRRSTLASASAYAAAALVLVAGGALLGRWLEKRAPELGPRYALLLYEDAGFRPGAHAALVAEYAAWADSLRAQGKLVMGEELDQADTLVLVGAGGAARVSPGAARSDIGILGGFFIVRVADRNEALTLARRCPHLKHGGRVVLRRLTDGADAPVPALRAPYGPRPGGPRAWPPGG
jgi:hypothetical protein